MGRLSSPAGLQGGIAQGVGGLPEFLPMNQVGNRINFLLGTAVPTGAAPWNLVGGLTVPQTTLLGVAAPGGVFDNVGYAELKANAGVADEYNQSTINPLLSSSGALTYLNSIANGASPYAIAITPNGKFLYVPSAVANTINGYTINSTTGAITSIGAAFASSNPIYGIAATNKFVYVVYNAPNIIDAYQINQITGALTLIGASVAAGISHYDCHVDPLGRFLFVTNVGSNDVSSYLIDQVTGIPTLANTITTGIGSAPQSVTVDALGLFVYTANTGSNNIAGFTINQITGVLTSVGANIASGNGPIELVASNKFLYATNSADNTVSGYTINPATGVLTSVGAAIAAGISGIAITPFNSFVYAANTTTKTIYIFSINNTTGVLTQIGTLTGGGRNIYSLIMHPSGVFMYGGDVTLNTAQAMALAPSTIKTVLASFDVTTSAAVVGGVASPQCRFGLRGANGTAFDASVDINPSTGNIITISGAPSKSVTTQLVTVDSVTADPIFRVVIAHSTANNTLFTPYVRPRTDGGLVGSVGIGRIQLEGTIEANAPVEAATEFIPTYESIAARISGRIPSNNSAAAWDIRTLVGATDLSLTQIDFTRTLCLCSGTWPLTLPDASNADIQPYLQGCQIKVVNTGVGTITIAQKNAANLIFGPGLAQAGVANFTLPYNGAATGMYNVSGVTLQLDSNQQWHVVDNDVAHGQQTFLVNGNFTVPTGVTTGWLDGAAAGAGGGGSAATGAGGGGSGGQSVKDLQVALVPGAVHAVVIGVGGAGGVGNNPGAVGGNSSFGALLVLTGGNPGAGAAAGAQGAGGLSAGIGSGPGGAGQTTVLFAEGGDGGGTIFAPANIAQNNGNGVVGVNYGGGGTGAGTAGGNGGQGAGNNGAGPSGAFITIRW